jgi:hypothetical protein
VRSVPRDERQDRGRTRWGSADVDGDGCGELRLRIGGCRVGFRHQTVRVG